VTSRSSLNFIRVYPQSVFQADNLIAVVRQYEGRVPALASCSRCKGKLFTPIVLMLDAVVAEEYLEREFDVHACAVV
jgi:hypothetical protein